MASGAELTVKAATFCFLNPQNIPSSTTMSSSREIDARDRDTTHLLLDYPERSSTPDPLSPMDQDKGLPPAYTPSVSHASDAPLPDQGYVAPPRMTAQRPRPDPNRKKNPVPIAINCCGHHDTYSHACIVTNCCGSSSQVTKACVGINMCASESLLEKAFLGANLCGSRNDLDKACLGLNLCGSRSLLSRAFLGIDLCGSWSMLGKACCAIRCCAPEFEEAENMHGA